MLVIILEVLLNFTRLDSNLVQLYDTSYSWSSSSYPVGKKAVGTNIFLATITRLVRVGGFGGWDIQCYPRFCILTSTGNVLAGKQTTVDYYSGLQGGLIMVTPSGDTVWENDYGTAPIRFMAGVEISGGDFVIAGQRGNFNVRDRSRLYLMRIDASGYESWTRTYGTGYDIIEPRAIVASDDGHVVIASSVAQWCEQKIKILLLKIDIDDGSTLWEQWYGDTTGAVVYNMINTSDGGYLLIGATGGSILNRGNEDIYNIWQGGEDILLIKTSSDGILGTFSSTSTGKVMEMSVSPNPFNSYCNINFSLSIDSPVEFTIIDLSGKVIKTVSYDNLSAGEHNFRWQTSNERSGVYLIRLIAGNQTLTRRVVLMR